MPESARSDDIDTHTRTSTDPASPRSASPTRTSAWPTSPATRTLCDRQAAFVAAGDRATTVDLTRHLQDAVASLAVCLAADESVRTGLPVKL